jgi:hypothetical protein
MRPRVSNTIVDFVMRPTVPKFAAARPILLDELFTVGALTTLSCQWECLLPGSAKFACMRARCRPAVSDLIPVIKVKVAVAQRQMRRRLACSNARSLFRARSHIECSFVGGSLPTYKAYPDPQLRPAGLPHTTSARAICQRCQSNAVYLSAPRCTPEPDCSLVLK